MEDFVKRLLDECSELSEREAKLYTFIHTNDTFNTLSEEQQALMWAQLRIMQAYLSILGRRIVIIKDEEE